MVAHIQRELDGLLGADAGMGALKIGDQELLFPEVLVGLSEAPHELGEVLDRRLLHLLQGGVGGVFWGDRELSGGVELGDLFDELVVEGGATNKGYLLDVIGTEDFRKGGVDTKWLDRWSATRENIVLSHPDLSRDALVAAAILSYQRTRAMLRTGILDGSGSGRSDRLPSSDGQQIDLTFGAESYRLKVYAIGSWRYRVHLEGRAVGATLREEGEGGGRACSLVWARLFSKTCGPSWVRCTRGWGRRVRLLPLTGWVRRMARCDWESCSGESFEAAGTGFLGAWPLPIRISFFVLTGGRMVDRGGPPFVVVFCGAFFLPFSPS